MKNLFKKISAILMAAIMVLAMASTAFAAKVTDKYTKCRCNRKRNRNNT